MMAVGLKGPVRSPRTESLIRRIVARFEEPVAAYVGASLLLVGAVSTYWDIATHIDIGRERFLTPPHIGIYSAVLVSAIAIALSGLADHFRGGESFLGALRHPFRNLRPGIGVAGAGMLTTLIAAPLDNAWHEIYGIDVTIWSPPHLLAIFGLGAASLGLAALVAPAVRREENAFYPVQLAAFLTALLITTGEFEFNAPQYRIAYHPIILGAASALVFTAAAGPRWRATKVALWFEAVRLASLLFLIAVDRSLVFVPFLVPPAVAADVMVRGKSRGPVMGVAVAGVTVVSNWAVLELANGLRWPGDDMILGVPLTLAAGGVAGWLGCHLGRRLDGEPSARPTLRVGRAAAVVSLAAIVLLTATPAMAHEVGGRRGIGTITWSPALPEEDQAIHIQISDVTLESGGKPEGLRVEARRAEHRVRAAIDTRTGNATLTLPQQGLWFLFVRAEADGHHLLWGDHFTVAEEGEGEPGTHLQRFTLGVDTLATNEPPAWVDAIAYGIAIAILLLLVRAVARALRRLPEVTL